MMRRNNKGSTLTSMLLVALLYMIPGLVRADDKMNTKAAAQTYEKAIFAGGCFWCMEPPFEKLDGVKSVVSGFAGGKEFNPEYKAVASGKTGHVEAVEITFDPNKVSYKKLLDVFWRNVNPMDADGQFVDRGFQYSTAIFTFDKDQQQQAESSKKALAATKKFPKAIVTPIKPYTTFYKAEEYHQDYYKKNPLRYKYYRYNSGRDKFLEKYWSDKE